MTDIEYTHSAPCPSCGRTIAAGTKHRCEKDRRQLLVCTAAASGNADRYLSDLSRPKPVCLVLPVEVKLPGDGEDGGTKL